MRGKTRRLLAALVVVTILAIPTLVVHAKEIGTLTISGPGIKGEVTLHDPDQIIELLSAGFFDRPSGIKAPPELGEGYNLTAQLLDGKSIRTVEMVYYLVDADTPGYVHYISDSGGKSIKGSESWGVLSPRAERAFREVMAANKIALQSAVLVAPVPGKTVPEAAQADAPVASVVEQVSAPSSAPATNLPPQVIIAVAAAIAVVLGAGLVLRRRLENRQQA